MEMKSMRDWKRLSSQYVSWLICQEFIFNSSRICMSIWASTPLRQLTHVSSSGIGVPKLMDYHHILPFIY
eukprot:9728021-Ditylum_brightwellii.AAC.1